ncbi:hypothetical protein BRAT_02800 [Leptospira interrogans serovar Bratislava]|uniref:DUF3658 domain-containing protein n=1 Tax=Leptospira interrogans TaxID=173 RepID=UPI0002BC4488|nr:DUF3658 domain-containing protein [Leptospira interrogans]AKH76092.1 hypothetical protein BRAT_02800 [Leptospira interrogans serovar Bratislava]EMN08283.1 PF12395 family protein [Leptospira interrogans serovar Muenchen str. Brem 129]KLO77594.1 hypothetical protein AAY48_1213 [Leptospira interrogans serovar Muenchen]
MENNQKISNECIHIFFDYVNSSQFKERTILFLGEFSIGPIYRIDTIEGQKIRQEWISKNLSYHPKDYYAKDFFSSFLKFTEEVRSIPKENKIAIWKSKNTESYLGLCFALSILGDRDQIRVIDLSEANRKILQKNYEIRFAGEVSPEDLERIRKASEKNEYLSEEMKMNLIKKWQFFSESKDILRIWKDDRVHSIPEDYYDDFIVAYAKKIGAEKDFYTATKLIGSVLYHSANDLSESHTSCDAFFDYRIRILIKRGVFEAQDIFKPDLKYKIKLIS